MSIKWLKKQIGLVFILPWIIGFLSFQLYPFISSFVYSFTDFNAVRAPKFVGLKNYIEMFTNDPDFYLSVKATFLYVLLSVPLKLIFALFIAVILNMKLRFVSLFRTVYYIPSILGGSVAVSIVWRMMFLKDGFVNGFLDKLHIPAVDWFGNPFDALLVLCFLTVWQFGSSMVIFLAGLKQIPQELYEAGRVDGASRTRMFFTITLPMITPMIFFNLIMQMINAFQEFTSAYVITSGGPMKATYLFGYKLYTDGFTYFRMGYASALSWVLFAVILTMTVILFKTSNRWVHYEDGAES